MAMHAALELPQNSLLNTRYKETAMSQRDVITGTQIVKKIPGLLLRLPGMVKGTRIANNTDKTLPVGLGLCFEHAVEVNPHGVAIIYEDRNLTYTQFNNWANQIAHYLLGRGIQKGDSVAILVENRPELLAIVLACAKIGAVGAMLNTSQKGRVLTHSISLVNPVLIVAGEECVDAYEAIRSDSPLDASSHLFFADTDTLDQVGTTPEGWQNLAIEIRNQPLHNPQQTQTITMEDPCFYIYTSGTTGLPKAVIFNHGRFMKLYGSIGCAAVALKKADRIYVPLPFYHATALTVGWCSALANGAGLIIARKFSVTNFWSDIRKHDATAFAYVGELCRYLAEQGESENDGRNRVHTIVGNGMRPSIWKEFKQRFGIDRVVEFYGSSEGNIGFINLLNLDQTVGFSPLPYAIVEYDRELDAPVRNAAGHLTKVEKGGAGLLIGEITEGTPFHGYTDPAKSESCIFRDVFKKDDQWFNSGDIMRDMGFRHTQFVDRTGDTFRWKGENVSTTEVEMFIDEMDGVSEAVVYGVEIPNTNGRAGMASIRLNQPVEQFDFSALLQHLTTHMSDYSIPVFLSINEGVEVTGTFKHIKGPLKEKGFDVQKNTDPLYVWLPKSDKYIPLTAELQQEIEQGQYRY